MDYALLTAAIYKVVEIVLSFDFLKNQPRNVKILISWIIAGLILFVVNAGYVPQSILEFIGYGSLGGVVYDGIKAVSTKTAEE